MDNPHLITEASSLFFEMPFKQQWEIVEKMGVCSQFYRGLTKELMFVQLCSTAYTCPTTDPRPGVLYDTILEVHTEWKGAEE